AYDAMARQNRVRTPGGTITRTVYDALNRVISEWVGTNDDGATNADPQSANIDNNMAQVTSQEYSPDSDRSQPQSVTQFVDDDPVNNRITTYTYDGRNLRIAVSGELNFHEE